MYRLSIPATNKINISPKIYAVAVPKSGCIAIKTNGKSTIPIIFNKLIGLFIFLSWSYP
jgi:hypothetical protein